jgi:AraC family transcriptional activator of pobA
MDGINLGLHNSNIMRANPKSAAARQLPTYALYGETQLQQGVDALHCESIAERSQLHDWEIRPHRHTALLQILYMARGQLNAWLEAGTLTLRGPAVVVVPPGVVHGFRFTPDVQGRVVTVAEPHAQRLLAGQPGLADAALSPCAQALPAANARPLQAAAEALHQEFNASHAWRTLAMDAALTQLLLALARLPQGARGARASRSGRADTHVQRFRALVAERFRSQPGMAQLAAELAITPTQLNRVCQQVLGCNALAVLHARLLLEAQRELAYTTMSIKQISLGLGFADAAYFTRFFERQAGSTPSAWRTGTAQADWSQGPASPPQRAAR